MNVSCPACKTRYSVDDSRVPPTGVTIRCPKCSHTFVAKRPEAEPRPASAVALPGTQAPRAPNPVALPGSQAAPRAGSAVALPGSAAARPGPPAPSAAPRPATSAVPLPGSPRPAARAASAVALPGARAPRIPPAVTDAGLDGELDLGLDTPAAPLPSQAPPPARRPLPTDLPEPADLPGPRAAKPPAAKALDGGALDFIDRTAARTKGAAGGGAQAELKVRRRNGRIEGPYGLGRLAALLRNKELQGNEDISEDGVSWRAMVSHPELNRVINELSAASDPFAFGQVDLPVPQGTDFPGHRDMPDLHHQGPVPRSTGDFDLDLDTGELPPRGAAPGGQGAARPAYTPPPPSHLDQLMNELEADASGAAAGSTGGGAPADELEMPARPRGELEVGEIPELPPFWTTYKTPILAFSGAMVLLLVGVFTHLFTPHGAFGLPGLAKAFLEQPPPPLPKPPPPPPAKVADLDQLGKLTHEGSYEAFRSVFATVQQAGPSLPDNMLAAAKARGLATLAYGTEEFPLAELTAAVTALDTMDPTKALGGNTAAANVEIAKAKAALAVLTGEAGAAVADLGPLLEQKENDEELAYLLGLAHAKLGQKEEAFGALDKALVASSDYAAALHAIGDLVREEGGKEALEAAAHWYEKALDAQPAYSRAGVAAADVYAALHREGARRRVMLETAPKVATGLPPSQRAPFLFALAVAHDDVGLLERVASYAEEAARLDPGNASVLGVAALALAERGAKADGLALIEGALQRAPKDSEALLARARIHMEMEEVAKAFLDLDTAREAAPRDWRVPLWEARFNVGLGKLSDARQAFERAARLADGGVILPSLELGQLDLMLGDVDSAFATAEAAAKAKPHDARAHAFLADSYSRRGQLDEAKAAYARALEMDDSSLQARVGMANALRDLGVRSGKPQKSKDLATSIPIYLAALADFPAHPQVLFEYGRALELQGNVAGALELYREASALDVKDVRPHLKMVAAYMEQATPDTGAAKQALKRAQDIEMASARQNNEVRYWEARIALIEDRIHDAVASMRMAVDSEPKNAIYQFWLGRASERNNSLYEAISYYEKAISLNSRYAEAHRALGWTALDRHQFEKARESFRRYLEAAPEDTTIWVDIGESYTRQNKDEEAMKAFQKAIASNPSHAQALLQVGHILSRQGKDSEAIQYFRRATKANADLGEAWCQLGLSTGVKQISAEVRQALQRCITLPSSPDDMRRNARSMLETSGAN